MTGVGTARRGGGFPKYEDNFKKYGFITSKNPTQLKGFVSKAEFIARNLYRGRCSMGSFSQPTSRRISNDMHISNHINVIITDQYFCCVVTAEPHQLQFSAR
jgi:hypothetical protein